MEISMELRLLGFSERKLDFFFVLHRTWEKFRREKDVRGRISLGTFLLCQKFSQRTLGNIHKLFHSLINLPPWQAIHPAPPPLKSPKGMKHDNFLLFKLSLRTFTVVWGREELLIALISYTKLHMKCWNISQKNVYM